MDKKSFSNNRRHSLLMPKDEQLEHRYGPKNSSFAFFTSSSSSSNSFGSNSNGGIILLKNKQQQLNNNNNNEGGPLNILRRSLRQITNPFKNRLFRLPATPRLSRSKKVLGRGENFTNWNFEKPKNEEENNCNSLLFCEEIGNCRDQTKNTIWQTKIEKRKTFLEKQENQYAQLTLNNNENNDLNEFLSLMEKINKKEIGGSCKLPSNSDNFNNQKNFKKLFLEEKKGGETVGVINNKFNEFYNESVNKQNKNGGKNNKIRSRPCIPSFENNNEEKTCCSPPSTINKTPNNLIIQQNLNNCFNMLPSTRYAPDGEIYAACWNNKKSKISSHKLPPTPQTQYKFQRPQNLQLKEEIISLPKQLNIEEENEQQKIATKSPSHSAITLLNINGNNNNIIQQQKVEFNRNLMEVEKKIQNAPQSSNIIHFPRTQLLQRRRSAAASSPTCENLHALERNNQRPQRSRSNREKSLEGEFEKNKKWNGSYYGIEVIKLMERHLKRQNERENVLKNKEKEEEKEKEEVEVENKIIEKKFKKPSIIFPFEEELFFNKFSEKEEQKKNKKIITNFVERKWIFEKLKKFLLEEETKIILLVGGKGTGKSFILRLLVENSFFGGNLRKIKNNNLNNLNNSTDSPQQQNQNNTVDSGIVVSEISATIPSPLGSQTSLNEEQFTSTKIKKTNFNDSESSLFYLTQKICAFHFCHIYDAKSCSIPEFICSLSAQLCACPQLKCSYGKLIRSNATLYQLATNLNSALHLLPLDLFKKLILHPLSQLYNNNDQNINEIKNKINCEYSSSSSSLESCDSNFGSTTTNNLKQLKKEEEKLPKLILIIIDALDEANFHQNEGNYSIFNLLINSINEWPKELKFVCTTSIDSTNLNFKNDDNFLKNIFGVDLKANMLERVIKFVLLDDQNCKDDAVLFVEKIMKMNPMLEKRLTTQFRRHSFFTTNNFEDNSTTDLLKKEQQNSTENNNNNNFLFNKFASNLVNRINSNFYGILLVIDLLAEGRLSVASLPQNSNLSQIYLIYFQHKFPSPNNFRSTISPILSVLIASLEPLTIDQLNNILNISTNFCKNEESLNERISTLWPLIGFNSFNKKVILMHSSLRAWLLGDGSKTEFSIDIRHGHILIALWIIMTLRKTQHFASPKQLFELSHHLLKANPQKYAQSDLINSKIGIKMPWSKNAQIKWLKMATEKDEENENYDREKEDEEEKCSKSLKDALLYQKNIFYTNSKISKFLLIAGANPNAHLWSTGENKPLLCAFARAENIEMIKILLKFGADINFGNPTTPLLFAVQQQNKEIIKLLCKSGADPFNIKNTEGQSVLLYSVENNYPCEIISILLNSDGKIDQELIDIQTNSFTINLPQSSSSSSTFSCDYLNENKIIKSTQNCCTLIKNKAINEAFQISTKLGFNQICSLFFDFISKNTAKFVLDTSEALSTACINCHSNLIQLFLSKGIKPYKNGHKSWKGRLALNSAIESGYLDLIVKILNNEEEKEENKIINEKEGDEGFTPLITAARYGRVGLVDLLVNRGAQLDKTDNQGRTPLFHAIEEGHFSTACILLEKGCNPCIIDLNGNSLLHILAKRPNRGLIGQLLEMGVSLEGRNGMGFRPIEVAIQNAQIQSIDIFLRRGARLRSLTWQIAYETHPPLILMLLRKLLEDAQFLMRKRRNIEAENRFIYALQKFVEIENFGKINLLKEENKEENNFINEKEFELFIIKKHVKRFKIHTLHSMAVLKRKSNKIEDALNLLTEAIEMINEREISSSFSSSFSSSEDESNEFNNLNNNIENNKLKCQQQRLFELYLLRAKCHFDARNMSNARLDAHSATLLRPDDNEAKSLASILNIN